MNKLVKFLTLFLFILELQSTYPNFDADKENAYLKEELDKNTSY